MSVSESPRHSIARRKTVTGAQEKKIAEDEFMAAAIGDVEWLKQSLRGQKGAVAFDRNVGGNVFLYIEFPILNTVTYMSCSEF